MTVWFQRFVLMRSSLIFPLRWNSWLSLNLKYVTKVCYAVFVINCKRSNKLNIFNMLLSNSIERSIKINPYRPLWVILTKWAKTYRKTQKNIMTYRLVHQHIRKNLNFQSMTQQITFLQYNCLCTTTHNFRHFIIYKFSAQCCWRSIVVLYRSKNLKTVKPIQKKQNIKSFCESKFT